ncbi:hypothetical protein ACH5RR_000573 [Cinchona calisaya]|uniref:Peptidase A1 domain-containing protein n=1 Tax=Cinchona calisaya TaxID=153742 RepID=A0ABD3B246_9GENT
MPSNFFPRLPSLLSNAFLAILLIAYTPSIFLVEAKNVGGFTVDLIHREYSPKSPFHNPQLTRFERQKNAFQRSLVRVNHFASTNVFPNGGEYLMKISYGTPPVDTLAILDTGSDLTWTQCQYCTNCYKERSRPFDPRSSSTFKFVLCDTKTCNSFPKTKCAPITKFCLYSEVYGDQSYTRGDLATETITLSGTKQGNTSFPNFAFGCGHDNGGIFPFEGSGLVGFGFGNLSLVTQLSSSIGGKFSYCLGPSTEASKPGKLNLGNSVSGVGVVSTPLFLGSYYTLTLQAISIDNIRLIYPIFSSTNNIIIDSGTTYTFLPTRLYEAFVFTVKQKINSDKTVPDPQNIFSLCYPSLDGLRIPSIAMHFKGAHLKLLNPINTFVSTSNSSVCLAFVPTDDVNILGNVQQTNFWVGYDLTNKIVSFKPADCTAA